MNNKSLDNVFKPKEVKTLLLFESDYILNIEYDIIGEFNLYKYRQHLWYTRLFWLASNGFSRNVHTIYRTQWTIYHNYDYLDLTMTLHIRITKYHNGMTGHLNQYMCVYCMQFIINWTDFMLHWNVPLGSNWLLDNCQPILRRFLLQRDNGNENRICWYIKEAPIFPFLNASNCCA